MYNIVGVRYREGCKVYNFDSGEIPLSLGDTVIVDSEQGVGVATVVTDVRPEERGPGDKPLKKILRKATDDDRRRMQKNEAMEEEAFKVCQQKVLEREMIMKIVRVEWAFDNSKATFYFTADGRVDFRDLVKDLAHRFKIRIEMRQIGVRDEAKMIGGFGPCGRQLCCSSFLRDFEPVSIRMAKKQDLVLNPAKISGICGRLMCCLGYEYSFYDDAKRDGKRRQREAVADRPAEELAAPAEAVASAPPAANAAADDKTAGDKHKKKRNAWKKRRRKKTGAGAPAEGGGGQKPPEK
ncbi:MAG: stage 0 sporulation family protein [Nitrospirota bacterium]